MKPYYYITSVSICLECLGICRPPTVIVLTTHTTRNARNAHNAQYTQSAKHKAQSTPPNAQQRPTRMCARNNS